MRGGVVPDAYYASSDVDWGSVPDWVGAIGTVLAFVGFGVAFWWEVRLRRLDDRRADADRREAEAAQARLVFATRTGGAPERVRARVRNASDGQIFGIHLDVLRGPFHQRQPVQVVRR